MTGQWSIQLYSGKHLHQIASQPGRCKVGQPHHFQDRHTLSKRNILSVQQVTITVLKLISGPPHPPKVKYSPKQQNICTTNHRKTRKLSPSMLRATSSATKTPTRLYRPLHLRTCLAAGYPIFHKPGSIAINSVEDLIKLYPNSFDRLGSLKGEYDIKVDPTVPPVQHARRKVPIESKEAIEEAIDYMVSEGILEQQIKPTPWVSSATYPVKPSGEVRPCMDARDLNKAIIHENHKPQTVEEIAHQLAGAVVFTKADALKAFLQVHLTEESSKLLVINTHKGRY